MAATPADVAAARARAEQLQAPVSKAILAQVADPRADIANERRKVPPDRPAGAAACAGRG